MMDYTLRIYYGLLAPCLLMLVTMYRVTSHGHASVTREKAVRLGEMRGI